MRWTCRCCISAGCSRVATRVIFVTGTDTNVGKTVVTALISAHLAGKGIDFRALKPFCSGERTDAQLLHELQQGSLSLEEINPFYFADPVSPWAAGRLAGRTISFEQTLDYLFGQRAACELLLIEGAGGLLAPLGRTFNAADLIARLGAEVILVAPNRLGVMNHTLLTMEALAARKVSKVKIALTDVNSGDPAAQTNEEDLRFVLDGVEIQRIPFFREYKPKATFVCSVVGSVPEVLTGLVT